MWLKLSLPKITAITKRNPAQRSANIRNYKLNTTNSQQTRNIICRKTPPTRGGSEAVITPHLDQRNLRHYFEGGVHGA